MSEESSVSVRAIIIEEEKLLVEYFAPKDIYFLPGGRRESGESLEQALQRELGEEISAEGFEIGKYLGTIEHRWHFGNCLVTGMNHFFLVTAVGLGRELGAEKGRKIQWLDLRSEEMKSLKPPKLMELLQKSDFEQSWSFVDTEKLSEYQV